jgi:Xaa-Pro aminopeptidase
LQGDNVKYIRKPEQIAELLEAKPQKIALELDSLTVNDYTRLSKVFADSEKCDASGILRRCRAVKTAYEIEKMKECGVGHDEAYKHIREIYREGMTDMELQVEVERQLRLQGSLGIFRIHGESMEIFMGNVLCGDNADAPSPYDFAMGGAGLHESLPVGCNGTVIEPGMTVMVDMCGNFNGYMTDMTRVFYVGKLDETAKKAHELSIAIHHRLMEEGKPGVAASRLYEIAMEMTKEAGLEAYFMGHKQQAGYIGHGVGIEVNESPVLAPRSRDVLEAGNIIALEPKYVIPGVGAVGVESTYVVTETGLECVTNYPEEIAEL